MRIAVQDRSPSDSEADRPHHIADEPAPHPASHEPSVQSPVTETGLPVAEQIRKEWDPNKDGGLPTPLR